MTCILLIDDDESLLDALSMAFEDAGYTVVCSINGRDGLLKIESGRVDVVVCDVNMPGLDGFSLCRRIREQGNLIPFVLLTGRDNEIDETLGLDLGADDYVSKPFSTRVLQARIQAILRRNQARQDPQAAPVELMHTGALTIDAERMEVQYAEQPVVLTLSEFRLLQALVKRPGIVLSRDRLLDLVRSDESVVGERIIDTYVRRLRRKFQEVDAGFDKIETMVGVGYRWKSDGQ